MAADYDAPRATDDDGALDTIVLQRGPKQETSETDEPDFANEGGDSWGAVDVDVVVVPLQASEFVCTECFLMVDRLQLSPDTSHGLVCNDCAA
jgi:hypothetical protein